MKISIIVKTVAIIFTIIVAVLLSLAIFGVFGNDEISDALIKTTEVCGVLIAAMIIISFVSKNDSKK